MSIYNNAFSNLDHTFLCCYSSPSNYHYQSESRSTLTHTLPLVNKQFHSICKTIDELWGICFYRLVKYQPDLWRKSLEHFTESHASILDSSDNIVHPTVPFYQARTLLDKGCRILQKLLSTDEKYTGDKTSIHALLYRHILSHYIRYQLPVFYMPDDLILRGRSLGFYFFEPRYRRLIWEVMESYPEEFRQGRPPNAENGISNPPMFIYANRSPLKRGVVACLVQVLSCNINPNGTANIEVVPVEHVRIEQVYEQVDMKDHLYFAKILRMRKEEQDYMELRDFQRIYPSLSLT